MWKLKFVIIRRALGSFDSLNTFCLRDFAAFLGRLRNPHKVAKVPSPHLLHTDLCLNQTPVDRLPGTERYEGGRPFAQQ